MLPFGAAAVPAAEEEPTAEPHTLPPNAEDGNTRDETRPALREDSPPPAAIAAGEIAKARDLLAAVRTSKAIERDNRPATDEEKQTLARFPGFGPLAKRIFPKPNLNEDDPAIQFNGYKDAGR